MINSVRIERVEVQAELIHAVQFKVSPYALRLRFATLRVNGKKSELA